MPSTTARLRMIRSRRWGGDGTMPKPQLPITAVVTPSEGDGERGRVPGDLRVVMRVQVDDARHQREPAGIDDLGRVLADLADPGDPAILHCNVSADRIMPQSIHHGGAADHEVMHRHLLRSSSSSIEDI